MTVTQATRSGATAGQSLQAAALSAVLTGVWLVISPLAEQPVCCDAGEYLRLAREPTDPVLRP